MDETHRNYLRDLGYLIHEAAKEAFERDKVARGGSDEAYEKGRLMAYYEVVSLMLSQATVFGIPSEDLAMASLDPDRKLLTG